MSRVYTVTTIKAHAFPLIVTRKRLDAFVFQCERAVYDAAEAQGLRDTRAAWNALQVARSYSNGRAGASVTLRLGSYVLLFEAK